MVGSADHKQSPPLILIVDSDADIRRTWRSVLEESGYRVEDTEDAETVVILTRELSPQLIVMDFAVLRYGEASACAKLRELPQCVDVPIIVTVPTSEMRLLECAHSDGVTDFLCKPLNVNVLKHRIGFTLRTFQAFRASRAQEARLRQSQRIARLGYWEWHFPSDSLELSVEFLDLLGIPRDCLLTQASELFARLPPLDGALISDLFQQVMARRVPYSVEFKLSVLQGDSKYFRAEGEFHACAHDAWIMRGVIQDVSEQRKAQDEIRKLMLYDQHTGLPNRDLFIEHLQLSVRNAQRLQHKVGLLYLRISRLGRVQDVLGPMGGDVAVQYAAQTIARAVNERDLYPLEYAHDELIEIGRIGEHDFAVLIHQIPLENTLARLAERLLERFAPPFRQGSAECYLGVHIGIACFPTDALDADALLRHGRLASGEAQRSEYCFFHGEQLSGALDTLNLEGQLAKAINTSDIHVVFQSVVDLRSGRVIGLEALGRWMHQGQTAIPSQQFIRVAEESGLIVPLGECILRAAISRAVTWARQAIRAPQLFINLSPGQLAHQDFVPLLKRVIADSECNPGFIVLEITEGALLSSTQQMVEKLFAIKRLGFQLAVDDFGSGFSSLNVFRKLPIDILKIDACLVNDLESDPKSLAIVRSIIALAKNLGQVVIAEGVESTAQRSILIDEGCTCGQGFLFGTPTFPENLAMLLKENFSNSEFRLAER